MVSYLSLAALLIQSHTIAVSVRGDGAPLIGAAVQVDTIVRRTDRTGRVDFSLPAGTHLVVVRHVGWHPDSVTITVPEQSAVTVDLEPVAAELEALVVNSNRTGRRVEDEALRVEIIGEEELAEKQLMAPGDIVMLLNETGGVRAVSANPALGGAGIRIRGLAGRYTQVLSDGLPLYGDRLGALGPLQIPPLDLGQVEIIKGPASALFGSSAMGGVVNLLTREIESGGTLLLNATSRGGGDAVGFFAGSLGRGWRYTWLGGVHGQTRTDVDRDGWLDIPGFRRVVLRPRLLWGDSAGQSFLATLGATAERRFGGTAQGAVLPDGRPFPEELATGRWDAGAVGRWRVRDGGPWLTSRTSATLLRHRHRFGPTLEPDRHRTLFAEAALSWDIDGTDLVVGAALNADRFRSERARRAEYDYLVPGAFVQLEQRLGRVVLAMSGRADHHSEYGAFVSPRASALWALSSGWSVRASIGTGYFAPTPLVEETERSGFSRVALPLSVNAERAASGSVDLNGSFRNVELNASAFVTRLNNPVLTRHPVGLGLTELVNADQPTRSAGVDVSVRVRRGVLSIAGSYLLLATRERDMDGGGSRPIPLTPRHSAGLVVGLETTGGRVGVEAYYTGRQILDDDPTLIRSEPYLVLGLLAEKRFGVLAAFINGENLLDVRQTDYAPLLRGVVGRNGSWTVDSWAPLDGRVLNAGLRWAW